MKMTTKKDYTAFVANRKGHDLSFGIAQVDFKQLVEAVDVGLGLALNELDHEFHQIRHELTRDNSHSQEWSHAKGTADYVVLAAKRVKLLVDTAAVLHGAETRKDIVWCNRPPEEQLTNNWEGEDEA
jgi:hypothetical protein